MIEKKLYSISKSFPIWEAMELAREQAEAEGWFHFYMTGKKYDVGKLLNHIDYWNFVFANKEALEDLLGYKLLKKNKEEK